MDFPILIVLWLGATPLAVRAGVVDRIAVVVSDQVFTQGEVLEELRVTAFQNGEPLDLGPARRRAAAERLVDQQLIRNEMTIGGYELPAESEVEQALREFQAAHYPDETRFRQALQRYGITEDELKSHLRWEIGVVRFIDVRFRPLVAGPVKPGAAGPGSSDADRSREDANSSAEADRQMETWLRQERAKTHIEFKPEAFQ